jgi:uncharacterized protein (DUF302 family)
MSKRRRRTMGGYGFGKTVQGTLETVRPRVEEALKEQGFGILTEIDVKATMKRKLDVDFVPYLILGACNPGLAHRALTVESDIGLLLPCNVVIYEVDGDHVRVAAFDPKAGMEMAGNTKLDDIGAEARRRLEAALDAVR